ncbi:hypothetical protein [Phenylobacterium sp.]|uniref:hypothetical protein n=1 Tax=Phenylobacterium sp. TaxID=1871053 RepID=UPI002F3ED45F
MTGVPKYLAQGFSPEAAARLAKPYKGMGHHYVPRAILKHLGDGRVVRAIRDHPLIVSKPRGLDQGEFYEYHRRVDKSAQANSLLPGETWKAKALGLTNYGLIGRLVFGAPEALKSTVGGVAGGVGGLAHDLQHKEDTW